MNSLEVYLRSFESYLDGHPFQGKPQSLTDAANYIMHLGGKRLRPAMVLMSCNAFKRNFEEALHAAMAIEVFHNFTLVHDDIMDAAPLRRGQATVHHKWNSSTAILCGDLMMFEATMFLQKLPLDILNEALTMFNTTAIEVCRGQQMDMLFETRNDVSIEEYLEMISLKTSVLLGCSFYLGALVGGAEKTNAEALYQFGKNLGVAFQLHDDILDAFADDPILFGKQIGGDILSNKKTYLLLKALNLADAKQLFELQFWLSNEPNDVNEKVQSVKQLFQVTGAKKEAEAEQQRYYSLALEALEMVTMEEETKKEFSDFAAYVMHRKK